MKTLNIILALVFATFSFSVNAQEKSSVKKESVKVWGNCGMCQSKIEKAAKAAGATTAKWDSDKQLLFVTYSPAKSSLAKIEKSVAGAGYDTANETAADEVYNNLHGCCQYDRKGAEAKEEKKGDK